MAGDDRRREWIRRHRDDPDVKAWLEANPPPKGWRGTRLEWAWAEMPVGILTGRPGRLL